MPKRPIPAAPGQPERYDCEYKRSGTVNLFVFLDAHKSWRHVKVTDQRTARDFAECMRDLADIHCPDAERIRVVMDNLSTHTAGALYEAFPAPEAHRVLQRLEFHYTPKHASWLNMVEIEIGVLRGQCLDRRIGERSTLVAEIDAWQRQRNESDARIKWKFTTQKAREKLARTYPDTTKES
jgi:DDE superfamily endonuclease